MRFICLVLLLLCFRARSKEAGKVRQDESTEGSSALAGFLEEVAFQRPKGGSCAGMKLAKGAGLLFFG